MVPEESRSPLWELGRIISVAVVLWWLVMCAALLWREYLLPRLPVGAARVAASEVEDREEWMGIYAQGQKIGHANTRISRSGAGWVLEEGALLRLSLLGIPREVRSHILVETTEGFLLRGFRTKVESGPTHFNAEGKVEGSELSVKIRSAGRVREVRIPLKETPWLPQSIRYLLLFQGDLQPGQRFRFPMMDPLTLGIKPLEIVVEARDRIVMGQREVDALRLGYSWAGLSTRAWVSLEGEMLREEGFGGLSMIRESREQALGEGWVLGKGVDLFRAMSVPAEPFLEEARKASYLKVRFSGADLSNFSMAGARQKSSGREVEVTKEDLGRAKSYELPHPRTGQLAELLDPTPLIQSDDQAIREASQKALKGHTDALKAVELILAWVHESLEKIPTLSVPSAVEVLQNRQGDCNEHAVLFAALARAAGIPTKLCAGILYQEGRFYYHAWNEVYLGQWFSLDSLLGQFPADATHIKFVEGELESQAKLVSLIGNLKAEILAYR